MPQKTNPPFTTGRSAVSAPGTAATGARLTFSLAALLFACPVLALHLGELQVRSHQGEPLVAELEIVEAYPGEAEGSAEMSIASGAEHKAAGLRFSPVLGSIRFEAYRLQDNRLFLHVTSAQSVEEGDFDMYLRGRVASRTLTRQYKVHVPVAEKKIKPAAGAKNNKYELEAPPIVPTIATAVAATPPLAAEAVPSPGTNVSETPTATSSQPTSEVPANTQAIGDVDASKDGERVGNLGTAEPPSASAPPPIEPRAAEINTENLPAPLPAPLSAPLKAQAAQGGTNAKSELSPEAQALLNAAQNPAKRLRPVTSKEGPAGAVDKKNVTSKDAVGSAKSETQAAKTVKTKRTEPQTDARQDKQTSVQKGDSLLKIASRYRTRSVTLEQVGLAIYRQNPHAFLAGNPHLLKPKAQLVVPNIDVIAAVSKDEAFAVLRSQNFATYRQKLARQSELVAETNRSQSGGRIRLNTQDLASSPAPDKLTLSTKNQSSLNAEEALAERGNKEQIQNRLKETQQNQSELNSVQGNAQAAVNATAGTRQLESDRTRSESQTPITPTNGVGQVGEGGEGISSAAVVNGVESQSEVPVGDASEAPSFWSNWKYHILSLGLAAFLLLLLSYMRRSRRVELVDESLLHSNAAASEPEITLKSAISINGKGLQKMKSKMSPSDTNRTKIEGDMELASALRAEKRSPLG